jgi:hypothetical protein
MPTPGDKGTARSNGALVDVVEPCHRMATVESVAGKVSESPP